MSRQESHNLRTPRLYRVLAADKQENAAHRSSWAVSQGLRPTQAHEKCAIRTKLLWRGPSGFVACVSPGSRVFSTLRGEVARARTILAPRQFRWAALHGSAATLPCTTGLLFLPATANVRLARPIVVRGRRGGSPGSLQSLKLKRRDDPRADTTDSVSTPPTKTGCLGARPRRGRNRRRCPDISAI